jgi:hypothetical protein
MPYWRGSDAQRDRESTWVAVFPKRGRTRTSEKRIQASLATMKPIFWNTVKEGYPHSFSSQDQSDYIIAQAGLAISYVKPCPTRAQDCVSHQA